MALDGTYSGVVTSMMGETACTITLKSEGAELTGSAEALGVCAPLQDGVARGGAFSCKAEGEGPLGHVALRIEGTVEGDRISGTIKSGLVKAKFSGRRTGRLPGSSAGDRHQ